MPSSFLHKQKAWPLLFESTAKWMPQECTVDSVLLDGCHRLDNEAAAAAATIPVISIVSTTGCIGGTTVVTVTTMPTTTSANASTPMTTTTTTTLPRKMTLSGNGSNAGIDNVAYENN